MTTPGGQAQRYERWTASPDRGWWTWLAIVRTGVKLAGKDPQTRAMMYMSLGLVVGNCALFYALSMLEVLAGSPDARELSHMVRQFLGVDLSFVTRIAEIRPLLWQTAFLLMVNLQLFWVMITLSRMGPGLIADDIKSRALPIYFAKPISPLTYLAGKWLVVATFIALLTLIPNLLSLIFATLLTGGLPTWGATAKLAGELAASGLGVMLLGGTLILALSSMSSDRRYVSVAWFAICVLPFIAQTVINKNLPPDSTEGFLGSISLHGNIRVLTEWLFDLRGGFAATGLPMEAFERALLPPVRPLYPAIVLGSVVVLSCLVSYRRVVRFSRSAANI